MSNEVLSELQQAIGYQFKDINLLVQALSHPSLRNNKHSYYGDYERLEFLGDTVLSFIITEYLYQQYSDFDEGDLSQFRNYLISKTIIAQIANTIALGKYIIMNASEEQNGGRTNNSNLENVMEAVIASIYLDSNRDIDITQSFILKMWQGFFDLYQKDHADPRGYIQKYSQKRCWGYPIYKIISTNIKGNHTDFICELSIKSGDTMIGEGTSIKAAYKDAAAKLIKKLDLKDT